MPDIARMSVKLSERTSREAISRLVAMQRAALIAQASATSGDPIDVSTIDPLRGVSKPSPEKIHPSPATRLSLFQAASVLQVTQLLSSVILGWSRDRECGT